MKLFLSFIFLSITAQATEEQNVKVTQIKNTKIKEGYSANIAEKWLDSETGVVCYVIQHGNANAPATISCVNYK